MTSDLKARLNSAIHEAVQSCKGAFTGKDIAALIAERDILLWEEAREVLAAEKVAAIADGMLRGPLHQPNSAQLPLAGFEDLPKYIRTSRRWMDIRDANSQELREFTDWYGARVKANDQRNKRDRHILSDLERLVRIVARYDRTTPGITVNTVLSIREVRAELRVVRS